MPAPLIITLSQLNLTIGDLGGNAEKMAAAYQNAQEAKSDLIVFPETSIIGYPPEDLIYTPKLQQDAINMLDEMATLTQNTFTDMLIGGIWREGEKLYNSMFLLSGGKIILKQHKHHLPNYGVFDEKRVFDAGPLPEIIHWRGIKLGLLICEDLWEEEAPKHLASQKPDIIISSNASPFEITKRERRLALTHRAATQAKAPLLYLNQYGGQDELVFDGGSFAVNVEGNIIAQMQCFSEQDAHFELKDGYLSPLHPETMEKSPPSKERFCYEAMKTGLRDYVEKNGFPGVVLGLSGGIDSALTACVAADALGPENVHCVMLESPYTSEISLEDAEALANNLNVRYDRLSITPGMEATDTMLAPIQDVPNALAKENIQSRLRGMLLMAISNSEGKLLITTGNKSELAVGYATLYGDMCGAYSVLKDAYKTEVYDLANWRNKQEPVIPERIITRPPSAELRDDQKDEDSLPPYEILDPILFELIEHNASVSEIVCKGYEKAIVEKVARLLYLSEYKRRQAPPGVKLSRISFGRDRRFPLTNRFIL